MTGVARHAAAGCTACLQARPCGYLAAELYALHAAAPPRTTPSTCGQRSALGVCDEPRGHEGNHRVVDP